MRHRKKLTALILAVVLPLVGHVAIDRLTRPTPPAMTSVPSRAGRIDRVGAVTVALLGGTPEEIGHAHTMLLGHRMRADEQVLWDGFSKVVPFTPARAAIFDLARIRYRHVDDGFPEARRRELGAEARAFDPDPYAGHMATYPRMVFLHALYDIGLSFEESPLLGCTAFGLGPAQTKDGHALFARAFDFEAADVFDRDKVVFVIKENDAIPFASVGWPGFVGVVTGMNAEGVAVAVHGGRAREPASTGIPIAFSLREALSRAHDAREAAAVLASQSVMVSHLVFVGDASGRFLVVERAPGVPAFVREAPSVTNHFEGPLAGDPRDTRVRQTSTTLPRRARIDELLGHVEPQSADVGSAVAMLRDHACARGESCLLGDRRTIDALIATHGVVFDLTARVVWVSEGPHLSGRFVKIDLATEITRVDDANAPAQETLEAVPADPVMADGRYLEGRKRAGGPLLQ